MDKEFKKQFKLSFIKSLKLGFNINNIKKRLKKQSYPSDLINNLVEELNNDKDIIKLIKPEKHSLLEKIKKKLFKFNEEQKIKAIIKLHGKYYNLIIEEKRKLNEGLPDINDILDNPENKKLINYFIKNKESKIKASSKTIVSSRFIIKRLRGVELKPETKKELNKIIDFINTEENNLTQETQILKQIKQSLNLPSEIKRLIQNEKDKLKQKENSLQKLINEISKKSPKFKEAISQL